MNLKKFNLKDKNIIITGAAGILGKQHAIALLNSNANLILTDINLKKLKETQYQLKNEYPLSNINHYLMNVVSEKSITKILNIVRNKKIKIDVLINNACLDPKVNKRSKKINTTLENFKLSQWNKEIEVGLTGSFLCSKIFGEYMSQNNKGVIINISSDLSVISPDQRLYSKNNPKPISYSVIKSGLVGLTKYLSTYWNDKNIRCNCLSPGGIIDKQNKKFFKKISKLIPMSRMANPDEYHSIIQFLCSDASSYLNGQNIVMDGGRSVW